MRSRSLALTSGFAVAVLAGCVSPQIGAFTDPAAQTREVVGGAMAALADLPLLEYTGGIGEISGSGEPATVSMEVTESGTSYGTAEVGEYTVDIMTIDGVVYVKASEAFWISYGASDSHAAKVDGEWVQVDPAEWFDAGAFLTPEEYAALLTEAMGDAGSTEIALPEPQDLDGVEVYPIAVGEGFVYVTVAPPHTVVAVVNVGVTVDPSDPGGVILSTDVAALDDGALDALLEVLETAIGELATVYTDDSQLVLAESSPAMECSNSTFKCTMSVDVTADISGEFVLADKVSITFKATADGGPLGSKKCDDKADAKIGETVSLSCAVTFNVPADGVEYPINSSWTVTGVATFKPDTEAILEALQEEFAELG
ncbi:hypothetical protein LX16_4081 [Stackebrandtia albiflava]|uniref:Uncharacterized protein n=1 Tax=Stackebrandtia albiflava TaxID=406432 RepID=A0A562UYF0_9ACTN|nr:hypothetical protein [Stackebrandtia albiflava]TWJ10661.1 hypothetical protein LX16_4081 [Stackebrandtia albiflava]